MRNDLETQRAIAEFSALFEAKDAEIVAAQLSEIADRSSGEYIRAQIQRIRTELDHVIRAGERLTLDLLRRTTEAISEGTDDSVLYGKSFGSRVRKRGARYSGDKR